MQERKRRQEEHDLLVARFQEKPDEHLVAAQSKTVSFPEELQNHFKSLTKHQQLTLVAQAGPCLEEAIKEFLAVPVERRHEALTVATNTALRQSFKKTFPQMFRMFK